VQELRLYKETNSWIEIVSAASHLISGAAERIYVSGHGHLTDALGEAIVSADRRARGSTSFASANRPSACTTG